MLRCSESKQEHAGANVLLMSHDWMPQFMYLGL